MVHCRAFEQNRPGSHDAHRTKDSASTPDPRAAMKEATGITGFDERLHASIGRWTGGLSPLAVNQAYTDWAGHLLMSPDNRRRSPAT